jgi:hypothetical protein
METHMVVRLSAMMLHSFVCVFKVEAGVGSYGE